MINKKKTAFITGAFGQDGYFLLKKLLEKEDYYVVCTGKSFRKNLDPIYKHKNVGIERLDIRSDREIYHTIKKHKPDEIYHLASFSAPILSWNDPREIISINGNSTIHLLEAIRVLSIKTKFFFASSAKIFGHPIQIPQTESSPANPMDPYSLGKYISHQAVRIYRAKFNIFACNGILYNHESHFKNINFIAYKICHYAKLLQQKKITSFSLLNLDSQIDFGDPRDYVDAMNLILQQNSPDDYIIAMNKSISIKDICIHVGKILNIANILSYIRVDQGILNQDKDKFRGDNKKLKSIGWLPRYKITDTLKMILSGDS